MRWSEHDETRRLLIGGIAGGLAAATASLAPGQAAELAPIYVALASPEFSYSTGQVFGAVGGRGGP